ncbi:hypothetical protein OJF2_49560 [Aquisphaera giovannonii]|uniref:Uncharacterized protein n=1 Tax=Aquisphaera giovannonii TaxID=406548 RepID=A0A5B9W761_9BACT|nr:DUF4175 family protein [Aquisphaera giovannonii]QEH36393.1 hypothetical protein OJF2_49560 [Aquisphaera giovannonii]
MIRELQQALERVARRTRQVRLWGGLAFCWLGWAMMVAVIAATGTPSYEVMAVLAGVTLASGLACAALATRRPRDPVEVARRIEEAHPDLDAGLITAVEEGLNRPGPLGFLQAAVVENAVEHNRAHDWGRMIPEARIFAARAGHAAGVCALVAAFGYFAMAVRPSPDAPVKASAAAISGATEVEVTPGDAELEKGSPLLVVARFPAAVPPDAKLVVEGSPSPAPMTRSLEDPTFAGRVESVAADLAYHVEFAGGKSPSYRVRVYENPELVRTDATLEYPGYTGLPTKVGEDIRHVTAVEGTRASLSFRTNKEVASATLLDEKGKETPLSQAAAGNPVYGASLTLDESHRYKVRLKDADGRVNKLAADLSVNVTPNRPPTIAMSQPGHDVRVSPVEELKLKAQVTDDFGVTRRGIRLTPAGKDPVEIVLGEESRPGQKKAQVEHLVDFEALKAAPDQLITYSVWAEDIGPDGKPRRTEGDMYFAEVRHFEEIFRQGEQPSASAENEQDEPQGGGNARQAEELAQMQKDVINGTWKILRREAGSKRTESFAADLKAVREGQEAVVEKAKALGGRLQDPASKAGLEKALKAMADAIKPLNEAADKAAVQPLQPALAAEQLAYQALLKLRARETEVVRSRSRQRGRSSDAQAMQRQLDQLELNNDEDRFEDKSRAKQALSQKEQEQRETRQVTSRLKELAQRQADVNERLKELQAALQAAKEQAAKDEIERQLKRLREQQQQILRDTDELQERMENQQNRERMADARQQVQQGREHVRQASEALEKGQVSQALTEGTRAGQKLNEVRDELRKQSANQFADALNQMRDQARRLDENQDRLSEKLDAWKESARQSLRDTEDRKQLTQGLQQQEQALDQLTERMKQTVSEAEESEPLLAKNLFDAARKADEQAVPESLKQAEKLAQAGFADEAAKSARQAGEGIDQVREGVEQAARSLLGDETAALRRAQGEVEDLADQIDREIAQATGQDPARSRRNFPPQPGDREGGQRQPGDREGGQEQPGQGEKGDQAGGQRPAQDGPEGQQPGQGPGQERPEGQQPGQGKPGENPGRGQRPGQDRPEGRQPGQGAGQEGPEGRQPGQGSGTESPEGQQPVQGEGGGQARGQRPGSLRGNAADTPQPSNPGGGSPNNPGGSPRGGGSDADRTLERLAEGTRNSNGPGGPITGGGFREWSDRMRDVEELLENQDLRAEAARIRDRVRGAREEFKRHSKVPDWTKLQGMVADPIRELRNRIAEEVRRRESPDSLVPIDRDQVPPQFAEGVRRYYERLGSGR